MEGGPARLEPIEIGAGLVQDGKIFQGKNHPEMGHILVEKHAQDSYKGCCPSHGACLEGLASGTAIEMRYGKKGNLLEDDQRVWELEAYYLAQAILNYYLILFPERIILGGGVMKRRNLFEMIRKEFLKLLNDYIAVDDVKSLIVAPELNDEQSVKGAISLCLN